MPQESEDKGSWLFNPKLARRVFWVTVGVVAWVGLMLFGILMSLGQDSHGGGAIVLPFMLVFVAVAYGFTFVVPERFPLARSIVSLVFLLIALAYSGALMWQIF